MSRYFFSVRVDSTLIPDDGLELTSLDGAHALALSNLTESASDPPAEGGVRASWRCTSPTPMTACCSSFALPSRLCMTHSSAQIRPRAQAKA
ncbi:DUF6894 family protein [Methylorubrum extorquens]